MMTAIGVVFLLAWVPSPASAQAQAPVGQPLVIPTASAAASTATARPKLEDYYTGSKKRSPFEMSAGGGGSSGEAKKELDLQSLDPNQFARRLVLKGLMRDKRGELALLQDPDTDTGLVLRGGRLYDYRRHVIRGVLGQIHMAQKTVKLISPDKAVRTLRLGEEELGSSAQQKD